MSGTTRSPPVHVGRLRRFRPAYELVFVSMEATWLASQLESGRSIESIAREVGQSASTVAYWVNKHGLSSQHASKHAARGGIDRDELEALVELGHADPRDGRPARRQPHHRAALAEAARSPDHGRARVGSPRRQRRGRPAPTPRAATARSTDSSRSFGRGADAFRCQRCTIEAVDTAAAQDQGILVAEAGGACVHLRLLADAGALHFHHLDPAREVLRSRRARRDPLAPQAARAEAAKCVLLCATCHAEVEAGCQAATLSADDPWRCRGMIRRSSCLRG